MLDNETLRKKIKRELKLLKLNETQEDRIIKELNYLSNLLVEVYIKKTKN